jgi:hypothetical protein
MTKTGGTVIRNKGPQNLRPGIIPWLTPVLLPHIPFLSGLAAFAVVFSVFVIDLTNYYYRVDVVNRHYKDDFSQPHWHGSSILSGVYYIEIEQNTGDIIFHKDRTHMNLFNPLIEIGHNFEDSEDQSKMNIYNIQNFGMQPLKNDLLLFPSQVSHSVDPNVKGKTRYTLAFNLFPRGTSGGAINTLTL